MCGYVSVCARVCVYVLMALYAVDGCSMKFKHRPWRNEGEFRIDLDLND